MSLGKWVADLGKWVAGYELSMRIVANGKHAFFSVGDSSRQAPATHLCHTFSGLAQASRALPASFWYQWSKRTGATILESGVSYVENFSSYSRSKLIKFSVDFSGFSKAHQTLIHTEMKSFKIYLVTVATGSEFGEFGG